MNTGRRSSAAARGLTRIAAALLRAAVFVTLATLGGGAFSVDRALHARRE